MTPPAALKTNAMEKSSVYILLSLLFGAIFAGCGSRGGKLANDTDSLSYVIGLSTGRALLAMDSTLNAEAVCLAICDVFDGSPKMSPEQARDYFLAQKTYFVHEKSQAYQERFLADLSKSDRSYVRARNGVTYRITTLGDQSVQNMSARDTVKIVCTIRDEAGSIIRERDTVRAAYRDLVAGLQEVVKVAGSGAKFNAWLPSKTAYDTAGNEELGIAPDQMLNYDAEILSIDYQERAGRR